MIETVSKLGLALLVSVSACTSVGPSTERDPSSEHADSISAPPPVEPAPAPEPTPEPAPEPEPLYAGLPVPGFVLYTKERTFVIPIDGSTQTIGEGLWVQDDRSSPPALSHTLIMSEARAQTMSLPRCPCLALDGACEDESLETRTFAAPTGALLEAPVPPCGCMRRAQVPGFPPSEGEDGETFDACAGGLDEYLVSMVAGQLFYQGRDWNGACGDGPSVYDAIDSRHELISKSPDLASEGMRRAACGTNVDFERPWPIDPEFEANALDSSCDGRFESEVFMLRRGKLWAVHVSAGPEDTSRYLERAVRPDSCPSVNDPCGDPQPFRERAKLERKRREFWIATDGSAALTAEKHAYALWLADADAPIEFELPNAHASDDVIGVHVHADISLLRALIDKHPALGVDRPERSTTIIEPDACLAQVDAAKPGAKASELGKTCFMYLGIGQWVEAERACLQGLSVAEEPDTRGAILFNLGLIAEDQGAREQAGVYYRESLVARPGNRTVERKLAKLKLP